jgi:hypothetical protein
MRGRNVVVLGAVCAAAAFAPAANAADQLIVCVGPSTCSTSNLPAGTATNVHELAKSACGQALPNGLSLGVGSVCSYHPNFDELTIVGAIGPSVGTQHFGPDTLIKVGAYAPGLP